MPSKRQRPRKDSHDGGKTTITASESSKKKKKVKSTENSAPLFGHWVSEDNNDNTDSTDPILEAAVACFRKGAQSTEEFRPNIQKLLEFIIANNASDSSIANDDDDDGDDEESAKRQLTPPQVALLLLPWTIRTVLSNSSVSTGDPTTPSNSGKKRKKNELQLPNRDPLAWSCLAQSLEVIVEATTVTTTTPKKDESKISAIRQQYPTILTPSTLAKLVIRVGTMAASAASDSSKQEISKDDTKENDSSSSVQIHARVAFRYLLSLYHPPLTVAVQKVWMPLAKLGYEHRQSAAALRMIAEWLRPNVQQQHSSIDINTTIGAKILTPGIAGTKATFELMASRNVLVAASQSYAAVMNTDDGNNNENQSSATKGHLDSFISRTLYGAHVEGLRTYLLQKVKEASKTDPSQSAEGATKSGNTFRYYQQALLETIQVGLQENGVPKSHLLSILPTLYRLFLEQPPPPVTNRKKGWQQQNCAIQFQLFQEWSMCVLESMSSSADNKSAKDNDVSAVECLARLLQLLLDFDVYLPSLDAEQHQLRFLESITQSVLKLSLAPCAAKNCLTNLTLLHHELLHDQWSDVLPRCIADVDKPNEGLETLVAKVTNIYAQLRQQSFWTRVLLQSSPATTTDNVDVWSQLWTAHNSQGTQAMARSIQSAPIEQTKQIFEHIQEQIASSIPCGKSSITLMVLLLRNIPVERSTAEQIAQQCQLTVDALPKGEILETGLTICGWLMDLHTNCAFWLGRKAVAELSLPVEITSVLDATETAPMTAQWQFLAIHRLQQLHSIIHDDHLNEQPNAQDDMAQCRSLASFIAQVASTRASWIAVAQMFSTWSMYSSDDGLRSMLRWMLTVLQVDEEKPTIPPSFKQHICSGNIQEEAQTALALIQDASFLEDDRVAQFLPEAALSCTGEYLQWAVKTNYCDSLQKYTSKFFLDSPEYPKVDIELPAGQPKSTPATLSPSALSLFGRSHLPILYLNGVSLDLRHTPESAKMLIKESLRLDRAFCLMGLFGNGASINNTVAALLALRSCIAKTMEKTIWCDEELPFQRVSELIDFLVSWYWSTLELCLRAPCEAMEIVEQLWRPSHRVFLGFLKAHRNLTTVDNDDLTEQLANIALATRKQDRLPAHILSLQLSILMVQLMRSSYSTTKSEVASSWFSHMVNHTQESQVSPNDNIREIGLFLFGELLLLSKGNLEIWPNTGFRDSTASQCLQAMLPHGEIASHGCQYVIACLAESGLIGDNSLDVIESIVRLQGDLSPVLQATFCKLCKDQQEGLVQVIDRLISREDCFKYQPNRALFLRLTIELTKDKEQALQFDSHGQAIFSFALEHFHEPPNNDSEMWEACLQNSADLVAELLHRRDIFACREVDLAELLCHMNSVLGPGSCGSRQISNKVFQICSKLLMVCFHRYSKQMHMVVPSVIAVLHSLQRHTLSCDEQKIDSRTRSQRLTRLYEQVYHLREVYKKHVIGLLLDFIRILATVSITRKSNMLPAVYFLLDTLSKYEVKQLNSYLDMKSKVLFKTVYQGYQKVHSYKGQ